MPWTPEQFKARHNHGLTRPQAKRASAQANAILRRTGNEELAIRTANKNAKRNPFAKAAAHAKAK